MSAMRLAAPSFPDRRGRSGPEPSAGEGTSRRGKAERRVHPALRLLLTVLLLLLLPAGVCAVDEEASREDGEPQTADSALYAEQRSAVGADRLAEQAPEAARSFL